jgi:hypothetical protein
MWPIHGPHEEYHGFHRGECGLVEGVTTVHFGHERAEGPTREVFFPASD